MRRLTSLDARFRRSRRRPAEAPPGLDHPYRVDEPDLDLGHPGRERALAAPGTGDQPARPGGPAALMP